MIPKIIIYLQGEWLPDVKPFKSIYETTITINPYDAPTATGKRRVGRD